MTKLDIYGGMLGAGKTTLIRQMLKTYYQGVKAAVIENEVGKVNLDAKELTDISVSELTSGCICCTFKGSFTEAVRTLIEQEAPEVIIIEPSGVADLRAVAEAALDVQGVSLDRCVMVIKADRFQSILRVAGEFLPEQIRAADTVYMNFTEKMSPREIISVKEALLAMHPSLRIVAAPVDALTGLEFERTAPAFKTAAQTAEKMETAPVVETAAQAVGKMKTAPAVETAAQTVEKMETAPAVESAAQTAEKLKTTPAVETEALAVGKTERSKRTTSNLRSGIAVEEADRNSAFPKKTFGKKHLYTWNYTFSGKFTEEKIRKFREIIEDGTLCNLWRVKGYLPMAGGTVRKIDYTFGDYYEENRAKEKTEAGPEAGAPDGTVVFIGPRIDIRGMMEAFSKF